MFLLQQGSDFDLGEFLQGLFKFAVFGFLFILPVIKSILEARKQRQQAQQQGRSSPVEDLAEEDIELEGKRAFEALERGEASSPPPLVRSAEAQPPRIPSYSAEPSEAPERSLENEVFEERSLEERSLEEQTLEPLAKLEGPNRLSSNVEGVSLEGEGDAPQGQLLGVGAQMETHDSERPTPTVKLFGQGATRRASLRQAIVMREVLGRPLALRDAPGGQAFER